jgi:hypothetical protein
MVASGGREMNKLPETVSGKNYVMISEYGDVTIFTSDCMTEHGYAILAVHDVTYDVPQEDPTPKFVSALEDKVQKIQAKAHIEIEAVKEKIQQLKAIEYKAAEELK